MTPIDKLILWWQARSRRCGECGGVVEGSHSFCSEECYQAHSNRWAM